MKYSLWLTVLVLLAACNKEKTEGPDPPPVEKYIKGADISFYPEMKEEGTRFYSQDGTLTELPDILKNKGINTIRLRLWHTPESSASSLAEVTAFTKTLKEKGFKIFITIHYSDTWADPGNQAKPKAWDGLNLSILGDSVYNYTKRVVTILDPDIIEVGNEISNGFLWPEGKISNQANFVTLLKKGIQGARDATSGKGRILVHCASLDVADWFYSILKNNGVSYDLIGISYYPFWTKKTPAQAVEAMVNLSKTFGKEVLIAETAYPFTLGWDDFTNNIIGNQNQLLTGYPASSDGQKSILTEIRQSVESSDRVIGFCYWAPEWIAYRGPQSTNGSSWENMALFDFNNKALPGLDAFK